MLAVSISVRQLKRTVIESCLHVHVFLRECGCASVAQEEGGTETLLQMFLQRGMQ